MWAISNQSKDENDGVRFGIAADYIRRYIWVDEGERESFSNLGEPDDTLIYDDCWVWLA